MRELKFRAYDREAEEFIYSDKEYDDYFFEFKDSKLKAFAIREVPGSIDEPPGVEAVEIEDPQQFIGLHDKKKYEIYEGDIIRSVCSCGECPDSVWEVRFKEAHFIAVDVDGDSTFDEPLYQLQAMDIEIIGNIYENPELLK